MNVKKSPLYTVQLIVRYAKNYPCHPRAKTSYGRKSLAEIRVEPDPGEGGIADVGIFDGICANFFCGILESEWRAIGIRYEIPLRRTASRFCLLTSFDPQKFDAGFALTQDDTQFFTVTNSVSS